MRFQVASTVRSAALRSSVLSLAKTCSIGLRSGLIGRQEEQLGAGRADRVAHGLALVTAEIVDDDDVAGLERRHQELLDIGQEAFAVDRPVDHARGVDAVVAQRGEEGQRPPVAMRGFGDQPFARGARPWVRVILVLAQVSSMKTRRAGSSRP